MGSDGDSGGVGDEGGGGGRTSTTVTSRTPSWLILGALAAAVVALFVYAYTSAYRDDVTCTALLIDRYDVPGQVCDGAIDEESTAGQVVGRAADMVGVDPGETLVPGLSPIIDGPLETVRRLGVAAYLLLLLLTALLITVVVGGVRAIGRLLARDPAAWHRIAVATRRYLVIVLGLYALSVVLFRPF
ncbi:MAG: hypothetical protein AAF962_18325 [Actinomycetota bacterium]